MIAKSGDDKGKPRDHEPSRDLWRLNPIPKAQSFCIVIYTVFKGNGEIPISMFDNKIQQFLNLLILDNQPNLILYNF